MNEHDERAARAFFAQVDEHGVANGEKARTRSRVIRRVESTPKDVSFEDAGAGSGSGAPFPQVSSKSAASSWASASTS